MTALVIEDVSHRYGATVALERVSLTVQAGEILCLVGPSGCGKSTLLRVAAGLEPLQSGRVSIEGRVVAAAGQAETPPEARNVGFVFQDFALFPHLSVLDNAAFGFHALPLGERRQQGLAALHRVGMADMAGAFPHTLSGGQQQRVALARAMAPSPRLMLLDEPFSGIDARLREELAESTRRVLKESGAASVVVTHDPGEAMLLGDRLAVMNAGRLLQVDAPDTIYRRPASPFVAEFLSPGTRFDAAVGADGLVATPVGAVAAAGLAPGTRVIVIIRQHALVVSTADQRPAGSRPVKVQGMRPMGAATLLQLLPTDSPPGAQMPIYARMQGRPPVVEGEYGYVSLNPDEAFVFPLETPTSRESGQG